MRPGDLASMLVLSALLCGAPVGAVAQAEVTLLAMGVVKGGGADGASDLSGLTGKLENGDASNRFDGIGSGLAYAGGDVFLALPDRGPNAKPYNPAVDDTTSWVPRFHTLSMSLSPSAGALPFAVTARLAGTTLLYSSTPLGYGDGAQAHLGSGAPANNRAGAFYFSGRSDNFAPGSSSGATSNGRLDPEGIRVASDGRSVFISDEYGPSLDQFDRKTGRRIASLAMPANLASPNLSSQGDVEIAGNVVGRTANKGMEGLATTPDGKLLLGAMQAALRKDAAVPASKKLVRLVAIEIRTGAIREYGYMLTDGSGVSEVLAINNHEFLVLERDGGGLGEKSPAVTKKLYRVDIAGAADISGLDGAPAGAAAVRKTEVLDIVKVLSAHGVAADQIPSKIEGVAFGPDVTVSGKRLHTLYVMNDNDFRPDLAGGNMVYAFGFADSDIPEYLPQVFGK